MRMTTVDDATRAERETLLTTGEAAKLLGSSRQHIVDLCNAGELPFETTWSHRRIRRRDVEAIRHRNLRMSRDERRSAWLNVAVAGKLALDPDAVLAVAHQNLVKMSAIHSTGQGAHWLSEWALLLDGPVERILEVLTSSTPWAREMRQNSPFAGVLNEDERTQALRAFKRSGSR